MAHPHEDLVPRAFDAFPTGDVDTLRELTDQDAVWHTPGRNLVSGYYRGQDEILGFFARVAGAHGGALPARAATWSRVTTAAKTRSWASLPGSRSSLAGPSAPSSTTSWPTTSMRSRSMFVAAAARGGPWRTEQGC